MADTFPPSWKTLVPNVTPLSAGDLNSQARAVRALCLSAPANSIVDPSGIHTRRREVTGYPALEEYEQPQQLEPDVPEAEWNAGLYPDAELHDPQTDYYSPLETEWQVAHPLVDAVIAHFVTRVGYDHITHQVLYCYYREMIWDLQGRLLYISHEVRTVIDEPEECEPIGGALSTTGWMGL